MGIGRPQEVVVPAEQAAARALLVLEVERAQALLDAFDRQFRISRPAPEYDGGRLTMPDAIERVLSGALDVWQTKEAISAKIVELGLNMRGAKTPNAVAAAANRDYSTRRWERRRCPGSAREYQWRKCSPVRDMAQVPRVR
jgi:hypothetical protein